MALPLALYHPASLFGVQLAFFLTVCAVMWYFTKAVGGTVFLSSLLLMAVAIATTVMVFVRGPNDKNNKDVPHWSTHPLISILAMILYLCASVGVSLTLKREDDDFPSLYLMVITGFTVGFTWFINSISYMSRWRNTKKPADKPAAAAKAKPRR